MSITLTEASKLATDVLLKGIIETIVKDSPILEKLPFIQITGNSLKYNREKTLPSAAFYAPVTGTWAASPPTFEQCSASLSVLGVDADVDNFLKSTRSNVQDLEAACIELAAKAVRHKFEDTFLNGDTSVDTKSFDGIDKLTTGGQVATMGANGASLTLAKLDEVIDLVKGGPPALLLMSKRTRRSLNNLARTSGSFLQADRNEFGQMMQYYDGVPVGVSDYISDAKTVGTSADCSTVYAMQLGEGALAGLTAPGGLQVETVGSLETKDATRTRVKWYVAAALFNTIKVAKLTGVRP